jgi:UDP-N-acetylmuramoyl-tripeptide--D-alanyl-D-alanine ligase
MRTTITESFARLRGALGWRLHRLLGDRTVYGALLVAARRWRVLLRKPVYFGIAGSAGKTTTKELLLGMLSHKGRGVGNDRSYNNIEEIAKALLRLRPSHRFFVTELSEDRPGVMDRPLALLQPDIGIVTVCQDDHLAAFASRDDLAREIGKLIAALPAAGTAVVNADDERVLAMAANCAATIITYGISINADLRAEDISSAWPDRLQCTLVRGAERVPLRTQLCGTHWIPSVLGAVGGGLAFGMTLTECAQAMASVAPFEGRMQPVSASDGVTFIRDDFKAPLWTLDACFDFMKAARAKRKIIVIGELSEIRSKKGRQYERAAKRAQEIADVTIFVGAWASSVLKAGTPGREGALRAFAHVRDAALYLNSITVAGDLVLLKGSAKKDHLLRIILARSGDVSCWRDDCQRTTFCNACPDRNKPSGTPPILLSETPPEIARASAIHARPVATPDEVVVVGLGNPESRYAGTPHNVGYEVVDRLAATLALRWDEIPGASIARGSSSGKRVCLVKIQAAMNITGVGLMQLSESMAFGPEQCVLVFDDLEMELGSVRPRLGGGAGGHRGVASILEAFQTDAVRRVKVGVGRKGAMLNRAEYLLTAFDETSRATIDLAILGAEARLLEMIEHSSVATQPLH